MAKLFKSHQNNYLTPQIIWLSLTSFFNDVASEIIYPLIPVFLTTVLKSSVAFVGLVEGIAESTASILKLFSGWFSDKIKKRKAIAFTGYFLSNLTRSVFFLVTSPFQVLLIRFFDRVGKGIRTAPRDALLMQYCEPENRGKVFGFNRAFDNAGAFVGPIVAFIALYLFAQDLRLTFAISVIPAIIALIIFAFLVKEPKETKEISQNSATNFNFFNLKEYSKDFKIFIFIIFLFTLSNSSDAFLILRAKSLGVPLVFVPVLWLILSFSKTIFNVPGGKLSDKIGRSKALFLGWIVYGLVYFGFGFCKNAWEVFFLFIVYGLYFGLTEGAERALVADLVPKEKLGTAYGIFHFNVGIAALPASILAGLIWQKFGYFFAFAFDGGLAIFSAFLVLFFIKK